MALEAKIKKLNSKFENADADWEKFKKDYMGDIFPAKGIKTFFKKSLKRKIQQCVKYYNRNIVGLDSSHFSEKAFISAKDKFDRVYIKPIAEYVKDYRNRLLKVKKSKDEKQSNRSFEEIKRDSDKKKGSKWKMGNKKYSWKERNDLIQQGLATLNKICTPKSSHPKYAKSLVGHLNSEINKLAPKKEP